MQVSKPVPVVSEIQRLCNEVVDGSFDPASRTVNLTALNEFQVQPVAIFGYKHDVWESLKSLGVLRLDSTKQRVFQHGGHGETLGRIGRLVPGLQSEHRQ
jgi:hypothetical protein